MWNPEGCNGGGLFMNANAQKVLALLETGPKTTLELRDKVVAPAPRIMELRRSGYNISCHIVSVTAPDGSVVHVGLYSLQGRADHE